MTTNPQTTFINTTFSPTSFAGHKRLTVSKHTLLQQLSLLKSTGRYTAFRLKWHPRYNGGPTNWPVSNHVFWDSDIAKWIEGACYFLKEQGVEGDGEEWLKEVRGAVEEIVDMICSAQQEDGYLNIYFTVVRPGERWTNMAHMHELYNAGHLIEAALAYTDMSGSSRLLNTLLRYVDHIDSTFGPEPHKKHAYCGHPEIELALLRLYSYTKNPRHLNLARYFLTERGNPRGQNGRHYYDYEMSERGEHSHQRPNWFPYTRSYWYFQAHKPIREMTVIEGHAVRAMYLLTGVADMVNIFTSDPGNKSHLAEMEPYRVALQRLWRNMTTRKMYLTGGIGTHGQWEGFGIDYFLPQSSDEGGCYAETCAAIGVMFLAERLLQLDLDGSIADIMELAFLNAVLTGMSSDGKRFTYQNRLASGGGWWSRREEWFDCACCPVNLTRLLGSLGGYFWSVKHPPSHEAEDGNGSDGAVEVNIHLYGSATLRIPPHGSAGEDDITITQTSDWPWTGKISFSIHNPSSRPLLLRLRIPAYIPSYTLFPLPSTPLTTSKGYLTLSNSYTLSNPNFTLTFPLNPRFISPHPRAGYPVLALARGPIIYCVEDVDNPWVKDHFRSLVILPGVKDGTIGSITEKRVLDRKNNDEDYIQLTLHQGAGFENWEDGEGPEAPSSTAAEVEVGLSSDLELEEGDEGEKEKVVFGDRVEKLAFVPYYFRANRGGRGMMRVGIRRGGCWD